MRILSLALCASLAGHGIAPVVGWSKHRHSTELDAPQQHVSALCNRRGQAFPTLFVLGGQKCGSTTLFHDLKVAFPTLLAPVIPKERQGKDPDYTTKEIHFFNKGDRFDQGEDLYSSYFPSCAKVRASGRIPMDGTPNYFGSQGYFGSEPWEHANRFFNSVIDPQNRSMMTFVIIVRDPAQRYVSAYKHLCLRGYNPPGRRPYCHSLLDSVNTSISNPMCRSGVAAQTLAPCRSIMLTWGVYWIPLAAWIGRFPNSRFIITTLSQYSRDKEPVHDEVAATLGYNASKATNNWILNQAHEEHHAAVEADVPAALALLSEYYKEHNEVFWRVLSEYVESKRHRVSFVGTMGEF